jgi:6,7-dimethyl-8-ribityllumazine synthase
VSEPYDRVAEEREDDRYSSPRRGTELEQEDDLESARENVLDGWPSSEDVSRFASREDEADSEPLRGSELSDTLLDPSASPEGLEEEDGERELEDREPAAEAQPEEIPVLPDEPGEEAPVEEGSVDSVVAPPLDPAPVVAASGEHAPGDLEIPPGYSVLEGTLDGSRRAVGIVVSRFNGEVTSRLLESALAELDVAGVARDAITVMPVPGAFELPIGAMALAKTRRFACIVALGCVIRGDTPHFDFVASEAASGLQLAALETGVPVSFGVLTLERADQAESRFEKGAEAVRTALEMADLFSHLRAAAAR